MIELAPVSRQGPNMVPLGWMLEFATSAAVVPNWLMTG